MFKYLLFIIVGILVFILYNYNYINNFTVSARNLSGKARRKYRNKECSATEDLEIDFSTYFTNKKIPIYFIKDEANKIEEDIMKLVTFLVQNRLLRNVQLGSSGPRANIRINPMGLPRTGGKLTPNIGTWGMPHEIIHMPPAEQLVAPITAQRTIISSPIFVHSKDVPIPTTRMTQNGPTIIMAQNKYTIDSYKNGFTELTLSPNDADNATLLAKLGTYYDNFLKNEHFLKGLKNLIEVYETTTYDKIINNEIPIYISLVWKTTPLGGLRGRSGGYHTDGIDDIWNLGAGDTGFDDGLDNDMDKILYNFTIILVPRQKFTYMNIQQKNKGGPRPETLKEPESNSTSVNVIYNKYINDYCYNWNQKLDTQFTRDNLPNWLGSYPRPLLDDVMYSQTTRRNIQSHGEQIFFQRDGRMRHAIPYWNGPPEKSEYEENSIFNELTKEQRDNIENNYIAVMFDHQKFLHGENKWSSFFSTKNNSINENDNNVFVSSDNTDINIQDLLKCRQIVRLNIYIPCKCPGSDGIPVFAPDQSCGLYTKEECLSNI